MSHKTTTHWKGGMLFESDNPSGKTVLMDTVVNGQSERFGLSPKAMMLSSLAGCSRSYQKIPTNDQQRL